MARKIRVKHLTFGVKGVLPSPCTIVTGVEWRVAEKKTAWWKRAELGQNTYLTNKQFRDKLKLDVESKIVLFGGSDWSEQLDDLDRCIKLVTEIGKEVALQVPCSFEQFQMKLGVWVSKHQGDLYEEMKHLMGDMADGEFFKMLGMAYLDNQLQYDYYVIAGNGNPRHYFIRKEDGESINEEN